MSKNRKTVMVFGVFDRLHPGHLDFLRQAREYGDELIAVVARDQAVMELKHKQPFHSEAQRLAVVQNIPEVTRDRTVMELKNKQPFHSEQERLAMVQNVPGVTLAVLGDREQRSYGVIVAYQPDVICVGYDQQELAEDLEKHMLQADVSLIHLAAYKPEQWHTSLLIEKVA